MKPIYRLFAAVIVLVSLQTAADERQADASALLAQLLQSIHHYRAGFTQQVFDVDHTQIDDSSGWVAWQQPGLFRWEVREPMQQSLLIDGQHYYQYDRDLEQLLVQPLSDEISFLPKLLLSGSAEAIDEAFAVKQLVSESKRSVYRLQPKDDAAIFKQVDLTFSEQALLVMEVLDELEQRTRFEFDPAISPDSFPAEDALFHLEPAPGTDIIRQ